MQKTQRKTMAALLACASAVLASCTNQPKAQIVPSSDNVVIPGRGIKSCYVGMPISQLQGKWTSREQEDPLLRDYLQNAQAGIAAVKKNQELFTVHFLYVADEYPDIHTTYKGKTDKGISPTSTIESVIHAYGQPRQIAAVISENRNKNVTLYYDEAGIYFKFVNGILQGFGVQAPNDKYPASWSEDIGNTSEYRSIGVR